MTQQTIDGILIDLLSRYGVQDEDQRVIRDWQFRATVVALTALLDAERARTVEECAIRAKRHILELAHPPPELELPDSKMSSSPPNPPAPAAKLEPCPFCGGPASSVNFWLTCEQCMSPDDDAAHLIIPSRWNSRPLESALRAEIAKAKADGERLAAVASARNEDNPAAQALDDLWKDIMLRRRPDYGDWEYPGMAFRHLSAEFGDLEKRNAELVDAIFRLDEGEFLGDEHVLTASELQAARERAGT